MVMVLNDRAISDRAIVMPPTLPLPCLCLPSALPLPCLCLACRLACRLASTLPLPCVFAVSSASKKEKKKQKKKKKKEEEKKEEKATKKKPLHCLCIASALPADLLADLSLRGRP